MRSIPLACAKPGRSHISHRNPNGHSIIKLKVISSQIFLLEQRCQTRHQPRLWFSILNIFLYNNVRRKNHKIIFHKMTNVTSNWFAAGAVGNILAAHQMCHVQRHLKNNWKFIASTSQKDYLKWFVILFHRLLMYSNPVYSRKKNAITARSKQTGWEVV